MYFQGHLRFFAVKTRVQSAQSYVIVGGVGGNPLAVRAQTTVGVNSVCCRFGGWTLPIFQVSACATASDDCTSVGPQLIRVRPENYICPGP